MQNWPTVLLLVTDSRVRDGIRHRLLELAVAPVVVRADGANAAVARYEPIAAILDEGHAALAPDDFYEQTCAHHVRLFTLPDCRLAREAIVDTLLHDAVTPLGMR